MSGFLFDTSILSVFGPARPNAAPVEAKLAQWVRNNTNRLYVPVIAILEIERGASKLDRAGGHARAQEIMRWLEQMIEGFGERVLAVDAAVARAAGSIEDAANAKGRNPGLADCIIAAIGKTHDLILLTANTRHFEPLPVRFINPLFDPLP